MRQQGRLKRWSSGRSEISIAIPFAALVGVLLLGLLTNPVLVALLLAVYIIMSLLTYLAYAADKAAARSGAFRTQESALHLLELFGGWPGALLAQRSLRHKTRKRSFQFAFWGCVVLNLLAVAYVLVRSATTVG